jgi:hypothetical protein
MPLRPRIAGLVAALVSVPLVAVALAGAAYIGYSLLTEAWYRDTFWRYGVKLLLLYALFALGVVAAASLALRYPERQGRTCRIALVGTCVAGIVAAALLELQFWSDVDSFLPHGVLLLPFVAWAVVALRARRAN